MKTEPGRNGLDRFKAKQQKRRKVRAARNTRESHPTKKKIGKSIRYLSWTEMIQAWGTLIAAVAAAVGIALSLVNIRELRMQREFTYRPLLTVSENTILYAYRIDDLDERPELPDSFYWSTNEINLNGAAKEPYMRTIEGLLELSNIGSGIADNLTVSWVYDIGNAIRKINKIDPPATKFVNYIGPIYFINTSAYGRFEMEYVFSPQYNPIQSIDYQQPVVNNPPKNLLALPKDYLKLLSLLFVVSPKSRDIYERLVDACKEMPPLFMDIRYYDLASNEFHQSFKVNIIGWLNSRNYPGLVSILDFPWSWSSNEKRLVYKARILTSRIKHQEFINKMSAFSSYYTPAYIPPEIIYVKRK